ncbi:HD domain-containing protein [Candidatus Saccharibacteria bacterium]|nr:HD domain-containing protein [Candidatus Saccharibacteria bacterium]
MEKPVTPNDVTHLLEGIIVPFYGIERDMLVPLGPPENRRNENDAEHSWSVTIIGCSLAPRIDPKLDIGLVAQFGSIHDIPELRDGDTSIWADKEQLASKASRESDTIQAISTSYSEFPWLIETLKAYERQDTPEARYVRAIDKCIAVAMRLMDEGDYYHRRKITQVEWEAGTESSRQKAHAHPAVGEIFEAIRAEFLNHPEYFYQAE